MVGGTASHVHVSLKRGMEGKGLEDAKVEGVPDLKVLETQFIAGLMDHFQAATAFIMPTFGSYERQVDGAWAVPSPPPFFY
jgi:glutamine synthetase